MRATTGLTLGAALIVGAFAITAQDATAASKMAHAHMGHVLTAWKDAPNGMGFLPTAIAEAKIAVKHADLMMEKPGDLAWMQKHTRHVINALDPSMQAKGPGLGFGVIKAANGAIKHINLAAESEGASRNVLGHAVHVSTSSQNTVTRAKEIIALGEKILAAATARVAAGYGANLVILADQLLAGADANGDGTISWQKNEGGLNVANKHMGLMAKAEGLM